MAPNDDDDTRTGLYSRSLAYYARVYPGPDYSNERTKRTVKLSNIMLHGRVRTPVRCPAVRLRIGPCSLVR